MSRVYATDNPSSARRVLAWVDPHGPDSSRRDANPVKSCLQHSPIGSPYRQLQSQKTAGHAPAGRSPINAWLPRQLENRSILAVTANYCFTLVSRSTSIGKWKWGGRSNPSACVFIRNRAIRSVSLLKMHGWAPALTKQDSAITATSEDKICW